MKILLKKVCLAAVAAAVIAAAEAVVKALKK